MRLGFTLVESLIAMALMAAVLPIALAGITQSLRCVVWLQRQDTARRIASSRLASIVSEKSWVSTASGGACDATSDGDGAVGYHWRLTITNWHDPAVKIITLKVGHGTVDDSSAVTLCTLVPAKP